MSTKGFTTTTMTTTTTFTQRFSLDHHGLEKMHRVATTAIGVLSKIVLVMGIEPTTLGLLDPRSNQLSYTSYVTAMVSTGNFIQIIKSSPESASSEIDCCLVPLCARKIKRSFSSKR